jgi:DNA (cytosine-5)-methyltransferase 1
MDEQFCFYEFFAGGGMARAGLGDKWKCLLANDVAPSKINAYKAKWGDNHLDTRDVAELQTCDLPSVADLAWASFPCQDLSVAGNGLGIGAAGKGGTRSGALWPFLKLMECLRAESRQPAVLALENVTGLLTSNAGKDFAAICRALKDLGYVFGAVVIDAKHFLPQSRPRIFIIAARDDIPISTSLVCEKPSPPWHTAGILRTHAALGSHITRSWRWWKLRSAPILPANALLKAIDVGPRPDWHTAAETKRLLAMMPETHVTRLTEAKQKDGIEIGSVYLRMRPQKKKKNEEKKRKNIQRTEISFGPTLGCLRTPRGGGSRPRIIVVQGNEVRTRLLSSREAAGLMGLPSDYPLPTKYEQAFQVIGDGVAAPAVRFLADSLIEPLARAARARSTSQSAVQEHIRQ